MKKTQFFILLAILSYVSQAQYLDFTQVVPETVLLPEQDFMKLHSDDIGDIVAGDLDNDGDIDYVSYDTVGAYQRVKVFMNDGNNQFAGSFVTINSDFDYVNDAKKLADIDNDGDIDIVQRYENANGTFLRVYFNDGAGNFTASNASQNLGSRSYHYNFFLADFNNDGYLDMLTFIGTSVQMWLNDTHGVFTYSVGWATSNPLLRVVGTDVLDYNADGFPDIFVNDDDSFLLINNGTGQFTYQYISGTNFSGNAIFLKDIDNDNDFDAIVEVNNNQYVDHIKFYTNDGNNNFAQIQSLEIQTDNYFPIAFSDINTDGNIDLIPIYSSVNNVPVILNDGSGHFSFDYSNYLPYSYEIGGSYHNPHINFHLVDLDNDSDIDILVNGVPNLVMINENGKYLTAGTVHIDRATVNMSMETPNYPSAETFTKSIMKLELADIDGDGIKDLLAGGIAVGNNPVTRIYKGTASGFDPIPYKYFRGLRKGNAMFADLNNDSNPDVVVIGRSFNNKNIAKYYLNDGLGNFTEYTFDFESSLNNVSRIFDVSLGNFNADSFPDIALISGDLTGSQLTIYFNDGTGNTPTHSNIASQNSHSKILTFDANADQVDDIYALNVLYINDGAGNMQPSLDLSAISSGSNEALDIDVDNDGDIDLLVETYLQLSNLRSRTVLYTNDGNGNYSLFNDASYSNTIIAEASVVDINNDNYKDIFGIHRKRDATGTGFVYRNYLYLNQYGKFYELLSDGFTTQDETSDLKEDSFYFSDFTWNDLNADNLPDLIEFDLNNPNYLVIKYNNGVSNANDLHFEASNYVITRVDENPVYNTQNITNYLTNNTSGISASYYNNLSDAENQTNPLPGTILNATQHSMPICARLEQAGNVSYYSFDLDIDPPVYIFHPNVVDIGNDGTEEINLYNYIDYGVYRFYHTQNDAMTGNNPISGTNFILNQPETTLWFTDRNHLMPVSPMRFRLLDGSDYTYNVQRIPFNLYVVNSQSTTLNLDDHYTQPIDLGFGFNYFYNSSNQLLMGDNGIVSFDLNKAGNYCRWSISDTIPNANSFEKNAIYGVYQDVDNRLGTGTIGYSHIGTAPFRKFIAFYHQTPLFNCNNTTMTSQIVLYETYNFIDVQVGERTPCTNWNNGNGVLGIIDITGGNAYTPPGRNTSAWTATDEAWRFRPDFSFPDFQYIICDANVDGIESFDLSVIQSHYSGSTVSIHLTKEDAETNMNPITGNYTNISNAQTIYARVNNGSTTEIKNVLIAAIDCNADYDIDGVPTNTEDINANGNYGDDDTDNDGIPDFVDDDDDGDMVLTQFELVNTRPSPRTLNSYSDTDGDGTPNYLDDDDDGDGTLTINEDYNGDANPTNDDINNNGIPDYLDDQVTANIIYLPDSAIHIYPIPAKDRLHIDFNIDITDAKMKLYTQDGKLIQQEMLHISQNLITLPETKGIYYLKILTDKGEMNKSIIVR